MCRKQIKENGSVQLAGWVWYSGGRKVCRVIRRLPKPAGALVAQTQPDGPAIRWLQVETLILRFNGQEIIMSSDLAALRWAGFALVRRHRLTEVMRDKKRQTLKMIIAPCPRIDSVAFQ